MVKQTNDTSIIDYVNGMLFAEDTVSVITVSGLNVGYAEFANRQAVFEIRLQNRVISSNVPGWIHIKGDTGIFLGIVETYRLEDAYLVDGILDPAKYNLLSERIGQQLGCEVERLQSHFERFGCGRELNVILYAEPSNWPESIDPWLGNVNCFGPMYVPLGVTLLAGESGVGKSHIVADLYKAMLADTAEDVISLMVSEPPSMIPFSLNYLIANIIRNPGKTIIFDSATSLYTLHLSTTGKGGVDMALPELLFMLKSIAEYYRVRLVLVLNTLNTHSDFIKFSSQKLSATYVIKKFNKSSQAYSLSVDLRVWIRTPNTIDYSRYQQEGDVTTPLSLSDLHTLFNFGREDGLKSNGQTLPLP